ncbi:sodium- and chloride-dependent betaine transporter-like [Centruroides vittatus]|uniref:sodium- and chloride-dependent betaine transporter-like n=1 Tax=Centruroides vittatus TaxID=120091 RepID=UPI00350F868D
MEEDTRKCRLTCTPPTGFVVAQPRDPKKLKTYLENCRSFGNLTLPNASSKGALLSNSNQQQGGRSPEAKPSKPAFTDIFEGPLSPRPTFALEYPEDAPRTPLSEERYARVPLPEDVFATVHSAPFRGVSPYGRDLSLLRLTSRRMSKSLPELRESRLVPAGPPLRDDEEDASEDGYVYEPRSGSRWRVKVDFVLCVACQTLGLNSIWRFPYYCYKNGGGSFVLAYLILLVLCGVPMLCMELSVGQIMQTGPIAAMGQLCPLMKGIGFSSIVASFLLAAYYSILVSWALFYLFNSFYSLPRWLTCGHTWNTESCWNEFITFSSAEMRGWVSSSASNDIDGTPSSLGIIPDVSNVTGMNIAFVNATVVPKRIPVTSASFVNYTLSSQEFLDQKLLEVSDRIENLGELRFELMAAVLFTWVLVYFALRKATLFKGRTVYVLAVMSHVVLLSLFLRVLFLEGAGKGLYYLFKPNWEQLGNAKVWLYALAQIIHSLGIIIGSSIAVGSCNKKQNNAFRDTWILAFFTVVTVLIIACIAFGSIGHLSARTGRPIDSILHKDPGLAFVIYSVAVGTTPVPSLWGVFFFIMFFWLGMEYQIKLVAVVVTSLEESYSHFIKQKFQGHSLFLFVICVFCFFSSIFYVTQAGIYFFQVIDHYVGVLAVVILAVFESVALSWIYGTKKLSSDITEALGMKVSVYFQICWAFLSPLVLLAVVIFSIATMHKLADDSGYAYARVGKAVGWCSFSLTLCWILIIGLNTFRKTPKVHFIERIRAAVEPKKHPEPLHLWDPKPIIVMNGTLFMKEEEEEYDDDEKELPQISERAVPFLESKNARETAI